ncbi:chromate efflux transporter [Yoonia sp. 208BN28-4]|uniref:chromate efflux transporter n=1 Tax=Yoonia sp. 208BN28-4 TaxID=3126505 RepID=UPI0030A297F6
MTPTIPDMIRVFGRIGLLSFGGPAAQIALMHKELVEDRPWLTEQQYLRALSFCMLLPGPEAMQLATYAGWRQRGIIGGLIGGGLFVIPGAIVIAALALLYGLYGNLPAVQALFIGVQATVVIIVIEALIKVSRRALQGVVHVAVACLAFIALFVFAVPFPVVIGIAAIVGALTFAKDTDDTPAAGSLQLNRSALILCVGGLLWALPILAVWAWPAPFLTDISLFFSKLAVVTFGGAYAVLAYMTQEVVTDFGWLTTAQMMDALGLAETTPGPLILVTQFVAMLAGLAQGGVGLALLAGGLTLWVTFVPCFIWIFAGAPLIDWLDGQPRLRGALAAITAAVVGVIANLSLWFATHVMFGTVATYRTGPVQIISPDLTSLQLMPVLLAFLAAALLLWRKWSLLWVLAVCALSSLGLHLAMT